MDQFEKIRHIIKEFPKLKQEVLELRSILNKKVERVSPQEYAKIKGIHLTTVYRNMDKGRIKFERVGGRRMPIVIHSLEHIFQKSEDSGVQSLS